MEEDIDATIKFLSTLLDADKLGPGEIDILAEYTIKGYFGNGIDRMEILGDWYSVVQPMVNDKLANPARPGRKNNAILQNVVNWFLFRHSKD